MVNNDILTEETYPYSMGTTPAITAIEELIKTPNNRFDTVLINIEALIRNNYTKDISSTELFKLVEDELDDVLHALSSVLGSCDSIRNPSIVVYAQDLVKRIPTELSREAIPRRITSNIVNKMFWNIYQKPIHTLTIDRVQLTKVGLTNKIWPHFLIRDIISKQKNTQTCLLVSHVALDLHVMKWFHSMRVVECFTGKVIQTSDLGQKVFKQDIPFNETTHVLLGDKEYLCPTLKIKEKRRLLALAEKEVWSIRSSNFIHNSVIKNQFDILADLSKRRG